MVKDPSLYPVEEFLEIVTKYNLRSDHVATLRHLVHALGNREEIFGQEELEKSEVGSGSDEGDVSITLDLVEVLAIDCYRQLDLLGGVVFWFSRET